MRGKLAHEAIEWRGGTDNNLQLSAAFLGNQLPEFTVSIKGLCNTGELVPLRRIASDGIEHVGVPFFVDREGKDTELIKS